MDFSGATFRSQTFFEHAAFAGNVLFINRVTFGIGAVTDSDQTWFRGAMFSREANFTEAIFHRKVSFDKALFQWPKFNGVTFTQGVWFDDAVFRGETHFANATFEKSSSFVNAKMKGETSFEGAKFDKEPPQFFGAKLHQGTVWRGITWPPKPKDKDEAGAFIDAYACLKLEMDRLKKHEDELDFFALELQSRRVLLGPWGGMADRALWTRFRLWPQLCSADVCAFRGGGNRYAGALAIRRGRALANPPDSASPTHSMYSAFAKIFSTPPPSNVCPRS